MLPFAYVVLTLFVLLGAFYVAGASRDQVATRVFGVFGFGHFFLPHVVSFDLPIFPPLGKMELASFVPFIGLAMNQTVKLTSRQLMGGGAMLVWLGVLGQFGTVYTNPDPLAFGPKYITGLGMKDGTAGALEWLAATGTTFWIGRLAIRSTDDLERALKILVVFGLIQLPLALIELRLSPQLHKWTYGVSVISFRNIMRSGGYKPVGYMAGGLAMAIFLFSATAAAAVLSKVRSSVGSVSGRAAWLAMWGTLAISKNLGANIFALLFATVLLFGGLKLTGRFVRVLVLFFLAYPILRARGIIDFQPLVDMVRDYSDERAHSLQVRFTNEDSLVERALLRPWFGWGGYGRAKVFDDSGRSSNLLDGAWIITLGKSGFVGWISQFGLVAMPIWYWSKRLGRLPQRAAWLVGGTCLMLVFRLTDYLPNGYFTTVPVFFGGALTALRDLGLDRRSRAAAPSPGVSTARDEAPG